MRRMVLHLVTTMLIACGPGGDGPAGDDTDALSDDPYAGLPPPAQPGTYAGTCPDMSVDVEGFASGRSQSRKFLVHVPKKAEQPGVLFLWHGNGDTAANFDRYMDGASLARKLDAIVIVPDAGAGGLGMDWSVPPNQPDEGDAAFFDDVLACLDAQFELDLRRVYTVGFSAGAMWTSWLIMNRAEHLGGAITFSGGSDGSAFGLATVNPYSTPAWDIPVLMTEGGARDEVIVNFQQMTDSMSTQLREDGSTVVVCSHTQGHTPPSGYDDWAWDFLKAHHYGIKASRYANDADPSGALPDYCSSK